jgi:hypothetical protein
MANKPFMGRGPGRKRRWVDLLEIENLLAHRIHSRPQFNLHNMGTGWALMHMGHTMGPMVGKDRRKRTVLAHLIAWNRISVRKLMTLFARNVTHCSGRIKSHI